MNELNNYNYMFLKKIYKDLHLDEVENYYKEENIISLDVQEDETYKKISDYFFLVNEVNIDSLDEIQKTKFHELFSKDINNLTNQELEEINKFIEETYKIVLFPNVEDNYVYYGPVNDLYICPRDAIALGIMYDCFSEGDDFEVENKINDTINIIQTDLAKKINKKVAVIPYTQMTLEYKNSKFSK